jgi:hypothetical protein
MRRFESAECVGIRTPGGAIVVAWVAQRVGLRLLGLGFLPREEVGNALLIPRCRSIHTLGMRFALDVAFLTWPPAPDVEVLALRRTVSPGRIVVARDGGARCIAVLEAPSTALRYVDICAGTCLSIGSVHGVSERQAGVHGPM